MVDYSVTGTDIDYKKAIDCAKSFSATCGVNCVILTTEGEVVHEERVAGVGCEFCHLLEEITGKPKNCSTLHVYGSYQSERFGGRYIYFCPSGMVYFASPITFGGTMKASLVGGPVMIIDKDEYIEHDILEKNSIPPERLPEFEQLLHNFISVKPEMVNHYARMLYIVSTYLSDDDRYQIIDHEELQIQQQRINEYIQSIKSDEKVVKYPLSKEKELLEAITEGNQETVQRLLNEVLGHIFFSSGGALDIIRTRVMELLVLLSRASIDGGADMDLSFELSYKYLSEMTKLNTIEELSLWLSRAIVRFTNHVFNLTDVKHKDVMFKVIDYIKRNYMYKLTLEDVSKYVFLSPSYLSKIFKDEMRCTFNLYLNRLRIEKSKIILLSGRQSIVEVCEMVGFDDQSYFTKVFKKMTGVTPAKFRERRGQSGN